MCTTSNTNNPTSIRFIYLIILVNHPFDIKSIYNSLIHTIIPNYTSIRVLEANDDITKDIKICPSI